jgi:steroid delta-isomerase-like uncharacterized protein
MSSIESNKDAVRQFIDRVFVALDVSAVDELVADDFESHAWPSDGDAKQALRDATLRMGRALADISFNIEDLVAENDRVVARVTSSARQVGEFMGMPATNKKYEIGEIHIFRLNDDGKIAEHWDQIDVMGLMKQLKGDDA